MDVTVAQREITSAVVMAAGVIDAKSKPEIMRNLFVEAREDHLLVTGSDLFAWTTVRADDAQVKQGGAWLLDGPRSIGLFPRFESEKLITFKVKGDGLIVQQGRSRHQFPSHQIDAFPTRPLLADAITIPALNKAERERLLAVPTAILPKYGGGVSLKTDGGCLVAEAVGQSQYIRATALAPDVSLPGVICLSRDSAEFITRLDGPIRVSSNLIEVSDGRCSYVSKLVEPQAQTRLPPIPADSGNSVELDAIELTNVLKRFAAIAERARAPLVQMWWSSDESELHLATEQDLGSASDSAAATVTGTAMTSTNLRSLLDLMKAIGDARIRVNVSSPTGAIKITTADGAITALQMPCVIP